MEQLIGPVIHYCGACVLPIRKHMMHEPERFGLVVERDGNKRYIVCVCGSTLHEARILADVEPGGCRDARAWTYRERDMLAESLSATLSAPDFGAYLAQAVSRG